MNKVKQFTPESYSDLLDHIIRGTGLTEAKAPASAAAKGDRPETDAVGQLVIRSGKQPFHISPRLPDGE